MIYYYILKILEVVPNIAHEVLFIIIIIWIVLLQSLQTINPKTERIKNLAWDFLGVKF